MAHTGTSNDEAKAKGNSGGADELKQTSKATIFHDFLGKGCGNESSSSPVVGSTIGGGGGGGGGGKQLSEASPSASVSLGGSSGGGLGPISTTSDLGSVERHVSNHFEGVPLYGPRGVCSGPGTSSRFAGTKRSNSDSFAGSSREKPLSTRQDSMDNSHIAKLLRNAGAEQTRRQNDEETSFSMRRMRGSTGGRTDANSSKWDRAIPINIGPVLQYPPCGQVVPFGYQTPQNKSQDANPGPSLISQAAADEGSRTGIKGSGILNSISATPGGVLERNFSGRTTMSRAHLTEPESSNAPGRHGSASAGRQMTIFYGGQAHVFDNVHPNKADVIMALAGSNGGSWSTTYGTKSVSNCLPTSGENEIGIASPSHNELLGRSLIRGNSMHERIPISLGIHHVPSRETKAADHGNKEKRDV